ncbi:type II secretion system F family protein, partial [Streptococcus suis]
KAKIVAMSQEAKSSAAIIGSLPPAVMIFVYMSTPHYISMLWTTDMGRLMLAGCLLWMFIGVLVMRKLINFDF